MVGAALHGLDLSAPRQGLVAVPCKYGYKSSDSMKDREFLGHLNDHWKYKYKNIHVDIPGRSSEGRCMVNAEY
jgi:hypothetical protein